MSPRNWLREMCVKIKDYWQLKSRKVRATLHDVSVDDSDRNDKIYMTESKAVVVNFDMVKREYMKDIHISEDNAKSVDALFEMVSSSNEESNICLLEFKNGGVENRDIERKARDSILIFQSITGTQLEDSRNHVQFVLVYNADKNPMSFREKRAIAKANQSHSDFCRFGLAHLRGFCFKNVFAYNQQEFEKKVVPYIKGI